MPNVSRPGIDRTISLYFLDNYLIPANTLISGIYGVIITSENGGDKAQYMATRGFGSENRVQGDIQIQDVQKPNNIHQYLTKYLSLYIPTLTEVPYILCMSGYCRGILLLSLLQSFILHMIGREGSQYTGAQRVPLCGLLKVIYGEKFQGNERYQYQLFVAM